MDIDAIGNIGVAYQPVRTCMRRPNGQAVFHDAFYETLVRPVDAQGRWINPQEYVASLEKANKIHVLDLQMLSHILDMLQMRPDIKLSWNVSARSIDIKEFRRAASTLLKTRRHHTDRLIVEILESQPLHECAKARDFVAMVQEAGSQVKLDDCGSGYFENIDNLAYLKVNGIKIDGSVVIGTAVEAEGTKDYQRYVEIRNGLLNAAAQHGYSIVVEHVETVKAANALVYADYYQGYFNDGKPSAVIPVKSVQAPERKIWTPSQQPAYGRLAFAA